MEEKRLAWLDSLRAMAVILVVLGHVMKGIEIGGELCDIIYRFHMPLFFMMSGIAHELFRGGKIKEIKGRAVRRCINLLVPAIAFTVFSIFLFPRNNIFFYYNTAWFLWHLLFISLATMFEDICSFKKKNELVRVLPWVYVFLWLLFGGLQLVLMRIEGAVYWKFAKEISKFFGYFLCFMVGRWMIRHQDSAMKKDKQFYFLLIVSVLAHMLGVVLRMDPEIALIRISYGILSSWTIVVIYYHLRKKSSILEREISKYSLEIYLIHTGILARMASEASFVKDNLAEQIFWGIIEFTIFLWVPILVAHCEKYVLPLRRLFHPMQ